ncbi:MAG TPA: hemolysin D [Pirellulales bacterium]|jgi:putative peptide zinc metalloprotease protein
MATATKQSDSSASRPLALRMRADLLVRPLVVLGRRHWGIKDPVSLAYFRLRDEEYAVLEMLDGHASSTEIIERFNRRFAPRRLGPEQLQAFLARLHADGLVVSNAAGQGAELIARDQKQRRRKLVSNVSNPLAIRFPGVDPTPFLARLESAARWLFSPLAILASLAIMVAALAMVATHFPELQARLPGLQSFFTPRSAILMIIALSVTKVLHELGHALTCRRYGGECHEMGVMLLVFAPCLYCNVSDTWMFPSRFRRIAVAIAGIWVEGLLASLATFVWWFSEPGLLNALALDVMIVCSVSTLLFNGNPLLRYDGYFILSDLVDIPNLGEKSTEAFRKLAARVCLGVPSRRERDTSLPRQMFLLLYAVASNLYRWALAAILLWFCYRALKPFGLERIAELLAFGTIAGLIGPPIARAVRFARTPAANPRIRRGRLIMTLIALTCGLVALAALPLPLRVRAPIVIEPLAAQRIYVSEPGVLKSTIHAGENVTAGQTLATLASDDVEFEITKLTGERDEQRLHLQNLERRRSQDRMAAAQIPSAKEALAALDERLRARIEDGSRLTLVSPMAGAVLPPQWKTVNAQESQLSDWDGTPLLDRNLGSLLETGTLFCLIGDPRSVEAVAIVEQADVERIRLGQRAEIKLDESAGETVWATVTDIAEIDLDVAPRQLVYGGELPVKQDEAGAARPLVESYQVKLKLDECDRPPLLGARGRVRIFAAPESALARLGRWLRGTFHFSS